MPKDMYLFLEKKKNSLNSPKVNYLNTLPLWVFFFSPGPFFKFDISRWNEFICCHFEYKWQILSLKYENFSIDIVVIIFNPRKSIRVLKGFEVVKKLQSSWHSISLFIGP